MKIAFYVFVVTLLLVCGTVSAECSYVLWSRVELKANDKPISGKQKDLKRTGSSERGKWEAQSSFPGDKEGLTLCYTSMKEEATTSKGTLVKAFGPSNVIYSYSWGQASIIVLMDGVTVLRENYRCLPDTINPNH
jgi:hypothetical protein